MTTDKETDESSILGWFVAAWQYCGKKFRAEAGFFMFPWAKNKFRTFLKILQRLHKKWHTKSYKVHGKVIVHKAKDQSK